MEQFMLWSKYRPINPSSYIFFDGKLLSENALNLFVTYFHS